MVSIASLNTKRLFKGAFWFTGLFVGAISFISFLVYLSQLTDNIYVPGFILDASSFIGAFAGLLTSEQLKPKGNKTFHRNEFIALGALLGFAGDIAIWHPSMGQSLQAVITGFIILLRSLGAFYGAGYLGGAVLSAGSFLKDKRVHDEQEAQTKKAAAEKAGAEKPTDQSKSKTANAPKQDLGLYVPVPKVSGQNVAAADASLRPPESSVADTW